MFVGFIWDSPIENKWHKRININLLDKIYTEQGGVQLHCSSIANGKQPWFIVPSNQTIVRQWLFLSGSNYSWIV